MAFQQTSASDVKDLLAVIATFAVNQGWTKVYDDIAAKGQVGLSKGSCHVAIGEHMDSSGNSLNPVVRTDQLNGGTVNDAIIVMAVATSLNAGNPKYYGHPGSPQTSYSLTGSNDNAVQVNDLVGAFSNVWLYSNSTGDHVHVVAQSSADRYAHLSFGNVDKKGMAHADVGYATGMFFTWWPDDSSVTGNSYDTNDFGSGAHLIPFLDGASRVSYVHVPDGVLDTAHGFASGAIIGRTLLNNMTRGNQRSIHTQNNSAGDPLDYYLTVNNQLTTGGVPLSALPVIFGSRPYCYLGEFPEVRVVNINNLNPGQEIKYGSEVWQVFPVKRKTTREVTKSGASPEQFATSHDVGFAFKKEV